MKPKITCHLFVEFCEYSTKRLGVDNFPEPHPGCSPMLNLKREFVGCIHSSYKDIPNEILYSTVLCSSTGWL